MPAVDKFQLWFGVTLRTFFVFFSCHFWIEKLLSKCRTQNENDRNEIIKTQKEKKT
jgi:hypothetical protein